MNQLQMKQKDKKYGFIAMLLSALGASLLRNLLTGKGVKQSYIPRRGVMASG